MLFLKNNYYSIMNRGISSTMKILVVNARSSSYKLSLYELDQHQLVEPLWQGKIEWGREKQALFLSVKTATQ